MSQIKLDPEVFQEAMNEIALDVSTVEACAQQINALTTRPTSSSISLSTYDMSNLRSTFSHTSTFAASPYTEIKTPDTNAIFSTMESETTKKLETLFYELGQDYSQEVVDNFRIYYDNLYTVKEGWIQADQDAANHIDRGDND